MKIELENNEVHIWFIEFNSEDIFTISSATTLSKDELVKAKRFKNPKNGRVWAFFHTAVRHILSRYINCSAADIQFVLDSKKKPYLDNKVASFPYFNLSHSGHFALLAVSDLAPIGVDIEMTNEIQDAVNVAKRFFSKQENSELEMVNEEKFIHHFYQIWTAKEAVIKANGWGMSAPLNTFDVMVEPCAHWFSPILRMPMENTGEYWVKHIAPKENCCGAICLNIIDTLTTQCFDINRVIVKEMFFENNNL